MTQENFVCDVINRSQVSYAEVQPFQKSWTYWTYGRGPRVTGTLVSAPSRSTVTLMVCPIVV